MQPAVLKSDEAGRASRPHQHGDDAQHDEDEHRVVQHVGRGDQIPEEGIRGDGRRVRGKEVERVIHRNDVDQRVERYRQDEDDHGDDCQLAEPTTPPARQPALGEGEAQAEDSQEGEAPAAPAAPDADGRHQVGRDQRAARGDHDTDGPELEAKPDEQQQPADRVGRPANDEIAADPAVREEEHGRAGVIHLGEQPEAEGEDADDEHDADGRHHDSAPGQPERRRRSGASRR